MKNLFFILQLIFLLPGCVSKRYLLDSRFDQSPTPPAPDYSSEHSWASLPGKKDPADKTPSENLPDNQATADVDVFFVHPTIFTFKPTSAYKWNADVRDEKLNRKTDNTTILYQASAFNGSCRIYAPRYRQAHISAYYTRYHEDGVRALDTAYTDVKRAFQFYLDHYNNGRPFIIASHSQGTTHTYRLLKDFFDSTALQSRLVAVYLIGMPINPDSLKFILPCTSADQTDCYCSWNTYARDYYPPFYKNGLENAVCTNPLSWKCDSTFCDANLNDGGILRNFNKTIPGICDAQVHDGMLWIDQPNFRGSSLFHWKIYHILDYNLFYMNIRQNVQQRVDAFWKR